ncbi:MAG: hypothetical protein GKR88_20645 [Flavobacteriaceae bacterium]|nr:MAG: hypothetical protein GKR88_20645 [Flavobacteriaceae bacterium]
MPFRLRHRGYNNIVSPNGNSIAQKKKTYQSQEWHDELGLNWHEWKYRFSDPAIDRFISIDPVAQNYAYNSPYAFAENKLGLGGELEGKELFHNEIISALAQGIVRIQNQFTGGPRKVQEAYNENLQLKMSTPQPSFDSEKARMEIQSKLASGLGDIAEGTTDIGHLTLDVIGIVDPTGLADGV